LDGAISDAEPTGSALVPIAQPTHWSNYRRWTLNPIFLTHLIATANHAPQTRELRRASPSDARTAYQARQNPVHGTGSRMRQVI
jgi:hypothetical protein